jgi:hypothetical protein
VGRRRTENVVWRCVSCGCSHTKLGRKGRRYGSK